MLTIPKEEGEDGIGLNDTFKKIISVAQQVIAINDKIYENFTKIIIEQQPIPPATTVLQQGVVRPNPPGNAGPAPGQTNPAARPREPGAGQQPPPAPPNSQSFNINTNTFIDDEEYGLNIEDLDM